MVLIESAKYNIVEDCKPLLKISPSGMSGKQEQMYCAIHTKRRSSCGPDPKDVMP